MGGEGDCIFDAAKYRRAPVFKQQFLSNLPPFYDPQADVYGVISAGFRIGKLPYSSGESLADEEQMANFRYPLTPIQTVNVYAHPIIVLGMIADLSNMLLEDHANAAYLESLEQNVHVDIYYSIYWGKGYRIPGVRVRNETGGNLYLYPLTVEDGENTFKLGLGDTVNLLGVMPVSPPQITPGEEAIISIDSPVDYFHPGMYLDIRLRMSSTKYPMPITSSWRIWQHGAVGSVR